MDIESIEVTPFGKSLGLNRTVTKMVRLLVTHIQHDFTDPRNVRQVTSAEGTVSLVFVGNLRDRLILTASKAVLVNGILPLEVTLRFTSVEIDSSMSAIRLEVNDSEPLIDLITINQENQNET